MSLKKFAVGLSAGLMMTGTGVIAAEEGAPAQPPQTHDIRAAELPPVPGFYYGLAYGQRQVRDLTDSDGDAIFDNTDVTQQVLGVSGLYVLPQKFYGGSLGFYGVGTVQAVEGAPGGPFPEIDTGNEFVDFVVGATWSQATYRMPDGPPMGPPPGVAYAIGLQATIPGGDGSLGSLVVSPNVALTYRTDPILLDGTEFSIRGSYNHVTERDSGIVDGFKYKDGDYISFDAALTERYRNFQFGFVGTFMKQIEDDVPGEGYPLPPQGRMEELVLGVVLNMDLGPTSAIKARYGKGVSSKSMFEGDLFGIQYVRKF